MTPPYTTTWIDEHRAPTRVARGVLRIYRVFLSPIILGWYGPACRFEPSCSDYASQAIAEYGAMRGIGLAMWRLARCHPLGGHGQDPVPARSGAGRD